MQASAMRGQSLVMRTSAPAVSRTPLLVLAKDSRIGKKPITVPKGVTMTFDGSSVKVKGPKGELSRVLPSCIEFKMDGDKLTASKKDASRSTYQLHGLSRSLVNNMIVGVTTGFEKKLTLVGVGYRSKIEGRKLSMSIGFTHDVVVELPEGVNGTVTQNVNIVVSGIDKELVGNFAANLRRASPPEPYGGKGVRYFDEIVKKKEGKSGKK